MIEAECTCGGDRRGLCRFCLWGYGLNDQEIADILGLSRTTILGWRRRRGLDANHYRGQAWSLEDRFWDQTDIGEPHECWEWQGHKGNLGYGRVSVDGSEEVSHRVSHRLTKGPVPEGEEVLHVCDNRGCVNPMHLTTGSHRQNLMDAARKGRTHSKLSVPMVLWARRKIALDGMSQREIARSLPVCQKNVSAIANDKTWAYLPSCEDYKEAAYSRPTLEAWV